MHNIILYHTVLNKFNDIIFMMDRNAIKYKSASEKYQ